MSFVTIFELQFVLLRAGIMGPPHEMIMEINDKNIKLMMMCVIETIFTERSYE